jgi:predicted nuclease with TOPRIM domain
MASHPHQAKHADGRRKTLVEQQADAGPSDPFGQSERIINRVQTDMEKELKKKHDAIDELEALKKKLRRVQAQIDEFQGRQDTIRNNKDFRKSEHKRLAAFLQSCISRRDDFRNELHHWKQINVTRESHAQKNLARQVLAEARGFYSGPGSTMTRAQLRENMKQQKAIALMRANSER